MFVEQPSLPMDNNTAERALCQAVVARKNFYGSGSQWSGQLAATLFSLMMTVKLHQLNPRTWLSAYLNACAANGNRAPVEVSAFLPWSMDEQQLAAMRAAVPGSAPDHTAPTALRPRDVQREDVRRRRADHGDVQRGAIHRGATRPEIAPERRAGDNSS